MSIDITIVVGVGFPVPQKVWEAFTEKIDPDGRLYGEEFFREEYLGDTEGLAYGESGSYYSGSLDRYVSVARLTHSIGDRHDSSSGGFEFIPSVRSASSEEISRLEDVAFRLGIDNPEIGTFAAVLWS